MALPPDIFSKKKPKRVDFLREIWYTFSSGEIVKKEPAVRNGKELFL